jgi:hypothetical protein
MSGEVTEILLDRPLGHAVEDPRLARHSTDRRPAQKAPERRGQAGRPRTVAALIGPSFVHPLFDYLVIGGGLSLAVTVAVLRYPQYPQVIGLGTLALFILVSNSAHFAASTVRLYTKPGAFVALPILTSVVPLIALVALTASIVWAGSIGPHVQALYLTWSPFHYAAQAYGLAVMYAYRAGCRLAPGDKRLLWWASLLPFVYVVIGGEGLGLDWLVPAPVLASARVDATLRFLTQVLPTTAAAAVVLVYAAIWWRLGRPLPLISALLLVTNGIWWLVLDPRGAFTWATIFHGLQYLAIATIFYVREQAAQAENRHGGLYHVAWFYGTCLLLGYGLFYCLPWAFAWAGFGLLESVALVVAAINIHHFVVDAFIWRTKKGDSNRRVVEAGQPVAA